MVRDAPTREIVDAAARARKRQRRRDIVAADKWFKIAALRGNSESGAAPPREVAGEMSEAEIAAAQRAARVWLIRH